MEKKRYSLSVFIRLILYRWTANLYLPIIDKTDSFRHISISADGGMDPADNHNVYEYTIFMQRYLGEK